MLDREKHRSNRQAKKTHACKNILWQKAKKKILRRAA